MFKTQDGKLVFSAEQNPKWKALLDIIEEIEKEDSSNSILIMVKNDQMRSQIARII
jgi:hypothetical protein